MSLDVSLIGESRQEPCHECGQLRQVGNTLFDANITHNLNRMAEAAGIYMHVWRPEEIGVTKASDLIAPLRKGIALLKSDPKRFEAYNAENGWGLYKHFVPWLERYLAACEQYPNAIVVVSR